MAISKTKILQKDAKSLFLLKKQTEERVRATVGKERDFYEHRLSLIIAEHKKRQEDNWKIKWEERQSRIQSYNDSFIN